MNLRVRRRPLQVKHSTRPMAAAITPPSAAPNTRAMFIATELS